MNLPGVRWGNAEGCGSTMFPSKYFALGQDSSGTEFVRCGNEVVILPVTADGAVVFIIEPSPAFGENALLLPCGSLRPGESAREAANRELQEEIGHKATRLEYLGEIRPWSKYLSVRSFLFLATDLEVSSLPGDEDYEIGQEVIAFHAVPSLIATGRLNDARVIVAWHLADRFLAHTVQQDTV
jgi:8-oxo-dGTP pyrophosphatase MutT (NUDIX family)